MSIGYDVTCLSVSLPDLNAYQMLWRGNTLYGLIATQPAGRWKLRQRGKLFQLVHSRHRDRRYRLADEDTKCACQSVETSPWVVLGGFEGFVETGHHKRLGNLS